MKEHLIVNFNFNKERRGPILLAFSMQVINAAVVYRLGWKCLAVTDALPTMLHYLFTAAIIYSTWPRRDIHFMKLK